MSKTANYTQIFLKQGMKIKQNNIENTYLNDNHDIHFPEILVLLVHQKRSLHKTQVGVVQCQV